VSAKPLEASKTTHHTEESSLKSSEKATTAFNKTLTVIVNAENQLTSIDGGKELTNANKSTGSEDRQYSIQDDGGVGLLLGDLGLPYQISRADRGKGIT